jgi:hypothetical protein
VTRHWLNAGSEGWRMDVMGDASFPPGYWETFRDVVKATQPQALIIGELWQKDSTLLRFLRGDRADTTMNYRLRDAVLGLLAPGPFDSKGFADSGRIISPGEFANRISSIREDYPDAAYYSLMNLLDSHDTERIRWTLTPGAETTAEKEQNRANVAVGLQRQKIAALIQFSLPGAPTIYYGDEAGLTGDDDPDDRRTYPLNSQLNQDLFGYYQQLALLRRSNVALTAGDLRFLLADDAAGTVAYGRKTNSQGAVVAINRSDQAHNLVIPVGGYFPDGTRLRPVIGAGVAGPALVQVDGGSLILSLQPWSAILLLSGITDLQPPQAPGGLSVTAEGDGQLRLTWNGVSRAAGYNLYRSPVSGGGWVRVNDALLTRAGYTDLGPRNAQVYYYVVRAVDAIGNESANSNEASGQPQ